MPSVSKKQQKFMGIVRSIQKGEQPASKFSKAAQDAAKEMKPKDVEKYAKTKHKGLPAKVRQEIEEYVDFFIQAIDEEFNLNENPAAIAAAQRMVVQNKAGKKVSVMTAKNKSYADKDPSAHKKAKSIFQKIKDKLKKEGMVEAVYKLKRGSTNKDLDELDALLARAGYKGTPNFNKMTWSTKDKNPKIGKIIKSKGGKKIREGTCGYGIDGKIGEEPAGPNLIKKVKAISKDKEKKKLLKSKKVNERLNQSQAKTLLRQLGGNKFIMMTGAKQMSIGKNGLTMKIGRNSKSITHVAIDLDRGKDLYIMKFIRVRKGIPKVVKQYDGVYADNLNNIFEKETGLYTRL
jgi:hypothetical protein